MERKVLFVLISWLLIGCSDGADPYRDDGGLGIVDSASVNPGDSSIALADGKEGGDAGVPLNFSAVEALLQSSFLTNLVGVLGITLVVYNDQDQRVFEKTVGDFSTNRRSAIASATKLVSALVLMRLIEEEVLTLNTTIGAVLGWTGEKENITLDQLAAFVSGIPNEDLCTYLPNIKLEDCVTKLKDLPLDAPPGTTYAYGSTHLHIAARMAEVLLGKDWNTIANEYLFSPLAIASADLRYVALPKQKLGPQNPLIAGGLLATMEEYAPILALLFQKGRSGDTQLIASTHMERFTQNRYTDVEIVASPFINHVDFRYGFGSWLECEGAVATCQVISSPGAYGFTPWVDYDSGYYAILGMESPEMGGSIFGSQLAQQLKPLIDEALAGH